MPIHVALHHRTHYRYDRAVSLGPQVVRLRPAPHTRARVLSYSLRIQPAKHFINWQQDPQSNFLARLVFLEKARELLVEVDLVVEMAVLNPFDFFLEPTGQNFPFVYDSSLDHELAPFLLKAPVTPALKQYVAQLESAIAQQKSQGNGRRRTIDVLVEINQRINQDIQYVIRMEPGVQTAEETLQRRKGSCRDSAWLLVQVLRHMGLAARFVSGYLIQLVADVKSLDGPSGPTSDFTDLHAWTEVYLPGAGWIGLDPTSGLLAGEGHLPLAATPDPQSAAPISGAVDECEVEFGFEMRVSRIFESPRVTLPYSETQWNEIQALGRHIDTHLHDGRVHLTMGGEPTFVSIDDPDGEEWNTAALGPRKRQIAGDLIKRLRRRFAPGGLLFYGQGKWYPGESLPRWALGCYWRKDGEPIWSHDHLIADESQPYACGLKEAKLFSDTLIEKLGVEGRWLMPAYEDAWYYSWRERRLPLNVDPLKSNLAEKEERERLARVFLQGLGSVVGYVLPLQRTLGTNAGWQSGPWFLRDETLWLLPGDSPIGYRLPLDSLPWVTQGDYPWIHATDPFESLPPLPPMKGFRDALLNPIAAQTRLQLRKALQPLEPDSTSLTTVETRPSSQQSAGWIVRTALCVEPRNGRLHIFIPPLRSTEDYLALIAAIEETAVQTNLAVILEGNPPPFDPRLNSLKVTPDPGVIEVNLQPAQNWEELVHHTTVLYDEAHQCRLGTEKFMIDGRHTGTGGGNHVVIGGNTPAQSPILRRPDLLSSLIGFWHNHPSLSYLFSGLFIGPTSQHPRIDEARNDALYELELAFRQVKPGASCPSWHVDRLFRNLLVDVSGNTHRTEFSIDKLFSPDSASGRLGLVELRSFEMPPHERMSLAQQLLLRALIARFWNEPYTTSLVRWGTELHDRFLLPHFVWDDFTDVLADLRTRGYRFKPEWFAPHFEFRFPLIGEIAQQGVTLELRSALEPWHVLGEEGAAGATVRYVDSSLERLQVKVRGRIDPRHMITCNGRQIPLHPTGTAGEYTAGIRYRAWQPPNCLHPRLPINSPLVFDILDTWNQRSIGGCTYHVMHPGGLSYSTFPVNAYEAESRRLGRFFAQGHTPGPFPTPPSEVVNREFPMSLDLRREGRG